MLQGALIEFDKTVFLQKNFHRNGLIMCVVVHVAKNKYELLINDL